MQMASKLFVVFRFAQFSLRPISFAPNLRLAQFSSMPNFDANAINHYRFTPGKDCSYENFQGPLSCEDFGALSYGEFDIMLKDINEEQLEWIGKFNEIEHLGEGTFPTPAFPVDGKIYGPNSRFMVPLVCQRFGKPSSKAVNVWFVLATSSPFTCLTAKTMELLFPGIVTAGTWYPVAIQDQQISVGCQVSRVGSNFEHVNILGVDAMRQLNVSPVDVNWRSKTFRLTKCE